MNRETGLILVSHGNFAEEALLSLEMIVGEQNNTKAISFHPGENLEDLVLKIEGAYQEIDKTNGVIVICDLYGGSPCNAATTLLLKNPNQSLAVFSGLNLGVLVEVSTFRQSNFEEVVGKINGAAEFSWKEIKIEDNTKQDEDDL